jgi:hypothetical protein
MCIPLGALPFSSFNDCRPFDGMEKHELACNMLQRMCAQLAMNKEVEVSIYPEEDIRVINNITFELDLIRKNTTGKVCFVLYILINSP